MCLAASSAMTRLVLFRPSLRLPVARKNDVLDVVLITSAPKSSAPSAVSIARSEYLHCPPQRRKGLTYRFEMAPRWQPSKQGIAARLRILVISSRMPSAPNGPMELSAPTHQHYASVDRTLWTTLTPV